VGRASAEGRGFEPPVGSSQRPLTADLTATIVHSYKSLINDGKPAHSLNNQ